MRFPAFCLAGVGFFTAFGGVLLSPVFAAVSLLPGRLTGEILYPKLRGGETAAWVAVRYGVHPVRVGRLSNGRLRVDTRRITPKFASFVNGVVLNIPECHVYLVHDGRVERDYPVAVSTPERPVPIGSTQVVSKQKNPTWFVPLSIQKEMASRGERVSTRVPPGPGNPLGPRWIGFWRGQFGMHGTNAPTSIKRYASHGCVRFRASDIVDLYDRVWVGTPVHIVYQPVLLAANAQGIWLSAYPDIYMTRHDYWGAVRRLARHQGVLEQVDWARVKRAIRAKDGIVRQVRRRADTHSRSLPALREMPGSPMPARIPSERPSSLREPQDAPDEHLDDVVPSTEPAVLELSPFDNDTPEGINPWGTTP